LMLFIYFFMLVIWLVFIYLLLLGKGWLGGWLDGVIEIFGEKFLFFYFCGKDFLVLVEIARIENRGT
jgi:hypothetical protein